jgi:predicted RNA-binding Zn ribbon-like protein
MSTQRTDLKALAPDDTFHGIVGIGGALCLEFVNTHEWRGTPKSIERLGTPQDVVHWARCVGVIDAVAFERLCQNIVKAPEQATAFLGRAKSFREAIFAALAEAIHGGRINAASLEPVNMHLSSLLSRVEISVSDDARRQDRRVRVGISELCLTSILIEVAWSLLDLLRGEERRFVKECATPGCHWMFVDRTKNKRRRWCAMSTCGGRAKAAAFKARRAALGTRRRGGSK